MRQRARFLLLFAPLLLAGCGVLGSAATTAGAGSAAATAGEANGSEPWLVVARGSATPSPAPTSGARPAPSAAASGFLPILPAARATPSATCAPQTVHFSRITSLSVVPGTTTATASWYNVGGYNLVEYRLTAISQDLKTGKQRDVGWTTVKPATACGPMTATVKGLDRATNYMFSLDAVVVRKAGDGTYAGTLFRSPVVRTK